MKKAVQGYDNCYFIDENANLYRNNHKMSTYDNGIGYVCSKLRKNGKRYTIYIHRIMWEAFIGKIPEGYEVNHIDHNKKNNKIDNLELVTHSEIYIKLSYITVILVL